MIFLALALLIGGGYLASTLQRLNTEFYGCEVFKPIAGDPEKLRQLREWSQWASANQVFLDAMSAINPNLKYRGMQTLNEYGLQTEALGLTSGRMGGSNNDIFEIKLRNFAGPTEPDNIESLVYRQGREIILYVADTESHDATAWEKTVSHHYKLADDTYLYCGNPW